VLLGVVGGFHGRDQLHPIPSPTPSLPFLLVFFFYSYPAPAPTDDVSPFSKTGVYRGGEYVLISCLLQTDFPAPPPLLHTMRRKLMVSAQALSLVWTAHAQTCSSQKGRRPLSPLQFAPLHPSLNRNPCPSFSDRRPEAFRSHPIGHPPSFPVSLPNLTHDQITSSARQKIPIKK